MRAIDTIVIHQSDSAFGNVAQIDEWHRARGWTGIGYHRVILNGWVGPKEFRPECDGMIQAGRPLEQVGAHVAGHNAHSIGICLIGVGDGLPIRTSPTGPTSHTSRTDRTSRTGRTDRTDRAGVLASLSRRPGWRPVGPSQNAPALSGGLPAVAAAPAMAGKQDRPPTTPTGYLTAAQWRALVGLCVRLMRRFGAPVERVLGHREFAGVAKSCPGFEVAELRRAVEGKLSRG